MGHYVRNTYMTEKGFLPSEYSTDDVFTMTTNLNRTIQSAYAQLEGIYSRDLSYPDYDEYFTLEVLSEDNCLITHCTDDECSYLGQLLDTSENSYSFSKVYSDLKELYEIDFFPRLRELTDMEDSDDDTMFNVVNYLYWA